MEVSYRVDCTDERSLCLHDDKFRVWAKTETLGHLRWLTASTERTRRSGAFWSGDTDDLVLLVNVVDLCEDRGQYVPSIASAGHSKLEVVVRDDKVERQRRYTRSKEILGTLPQVEIGYGHFRTCSSP